MTTPTTKGTGKMSDTTVTVAENNKDQAAITLHPDGRVTFGAHLHPDTGAELIWNNILRMAEAHNATFKNDLARENERLRRGSDAMMAKLTQMGAPITADFFGAVGGGVADDGPSLQAFMDYQSIVSAAKRAAWSDK
jgi:hypothetical protein